MQYCYDFVSGKRPKFHQKRMICYTFLKGGGVHATLPAADPMLQLGGPHQFFPAFMAQAAQRLYVFLENRVRFGKQSHGAFDTRFA